VTPAFAFDLCFFLISFVGLGPPRLGGFVFFFFCGACILARGGRDFSCPGPPVLFCRRFAWGFEYKNLTHMGEILPTGVPGGLHGEAKGGVCAPPPP